MTLIAFPNDVFEEDAYPRTMRCQLRSVYELHERLVVANDYHPNWIVIPGVITRRSDLDKKPVSLAALRALAIQSEFPPTLTVTFGRPPQLSRRAMTISADTIVVEDTTRSLK
jgi:hypothetical protein